MSAAHAKTAVTSNTAKSAHGTTHGSIIRQSMIDGVGTLGNSFFVKVNNGIASMNPFQRLPIACAAVVAGFVGR